MYDAEIPAGVKLFAWEHGALWPLAVKRHKEQGGTLGYDGRVCGPVPRNSEIEVRYEGDWTTADAVARQLERAGFRQVLVIKGMPQESEVGRG